MAEPTANETTLPVPEPVDSVVKQFAPKRVREPEKTAAQALLERQVAARSKLAVAGMRLSDTLENIRGRQAEATAAAAAAPIATNDFFAALEALTAEYERLAEQFEVDVLDLARRF